MGKQEIGPVLVAVLLLFVVMGLREVIAGETVRMAQIFVFSFLVILVSVFSKKGVAYMLDASVEHRIWHLKRYGFKTGSRFKRPMPFGVIVPLLFSLVSLGLFKVMTFLTYETSALKHRAAKRFGHYSYTSMTDWHNGLIGAAGIVAVFVVSIIGYFSSIT